MKWIYLLSWAGFICVLAAGCNRAANHPDGGANSPEQLAERFIVAINTKDSALQQALIHPRSLENTWADQKAYIGETLSRDFRYTLPPDATVRMAPLDGPDLPFYTMVDWPVTPTHSMEITFTDGQNKTTNIIRFIAVDQGRWFVIVPHLNAENLSRYAEQRAAKQ